MPETRVGNRSPAKKIGSAKGEKNKPVKIPASFPEKSEKIRDGALPKGLENPNWSGEKIEEMLSRGNADKVRVNDALSEIEYPFTLLLLINAAEYSEMKNTVVEKFWQKNGIIYIGLNSGYAAIRKEISKTGKGMDGLFFIDMVSVESGAKTEKSENVAYLSSPLDLTECLIAVEKKLGEFAARKPIVVLDSVSTLLIYADPHSVEKFIHSILVKVNSCSAGAIVLSSGAGEHEGVTNTIGQFFEKIIRM